MKKNCLTVLFFMLILFGSKSYANKPKIFIASEFQCTYCKDKNGVPIPSKNNDENGYLRAFEGWVHQEIKKAYPCTEILSSSDIKDLLYFTRQKELMGEEQDMKHLGEAQACDYLVHLNTIYLPNHVILTVNCLQAKYVKENQIWKNIIRLYKKTTLEALGEAWQDLAKQLTDKLKKEEICWYKGTVDVTINSIESENKKETYPVYCNNSDETYLKEESMLKTKDSKWNLKKTGLASADGTMTSVINEETIRNEENGCYKCTSGKTGRHISYEKINGSSTVNGLSSSRVDHSDFKKLSTRKDARIQLIFLETDSFMLQIKATSDTGDLKLKRETREEGVCDNKNTTIEKSTLSKKVDLSLPGIYGPFPGNSQNDVLTGKKTFKTKDGKNEESTITLEFNLKRDLK